MSDMFNQYQIISQLARGTSSHADIAFAPADPEQKVVIKIFDSLRLNGAPGYKHFLSEVETLKQLSHVHIMPILEAGIEKYHPYLIYPYARNGSLVDQLKQSPTGRLSFQKAVQLLSQVGQALECARRRAIPHGNIKPENILFNESGEVLLNDFRLMSLSQSAAYCLDTRSACYMAPEQFAGEVSAASDQYALGCIAYELFTGRVPFSALAISTLRTRHSLERPVSLRLFEPNLPTYIENTIFKAMAKEPEQRYQDITAFISALVADSLPQSLVTTSAPVWDEILELKQEPVDIADGVVQERVVENVEPAQRTFVPEIAVASGDAEQAKAVTIPQILAAEVPLASVAPAVIPASSSHRLPRRSVHSPSQSSKLAGRTWAAITVAALLIFSMVVVPMAFSRPQPDKKVLLPTAALGTSTPNAAITVSSSPTVLSTGTPETSPTALQSSKPVLTPTPTMLPAATLPAATSPVATRVPVGTQIPLLNAGFETPGVGTRSYMYNPASAGWVFSPQTGGSGSGVTGGNSGISSGSDNVPEGMQVGFLQSHGSISQAVDLPAGTYKVTFYISQPRNSFNTQSIQVQIDSQIIFTIQPGSSYNKRTSSSFTVSAGVHTLLFQGLSDWDQSVALIDKVAMSAV